MVECYLEIFQEEIPARMQAKAAEFLRTTFCKKLKELSVEFSEAVVFSTSLRLVMQVNGLDLVQPDRHIETKGPLLSAPEKAIQGFLKSNGLNSIDECARLQTPKGDALLMKKKVKGLATETVLPTILADILNNFTWPKTMRFADNDFRWVRPLRQIVLVFDGQPLGVEIELGSGKITLAKEIVLDRFKPLSCAAPKSFTEYKELMANVGIVLDPLQRENLIEKQLKHHSQIHGCTWKKDIGLLREVAGLTEQPTVIIGTIDNRFMALPDAVLQLAMKVHQKYFVFHKTESNELSGHFAVVTANPNSDTHQTILDGNLRVLRSRLQDAEFFLIQDQRISLRDHSDKLHQLRFVEELGSMHDKALRVSKLLQSGPLNISTDQADNLSLMSKADLVTEMVGEFPELQGFIGSYYAAAQNADEAISDAIAEHYMPKGPSDSIPDTEIGSCLAMMDKLDTIAGFAVKDALPKGSGDAFAIRRAMLGVIRIMIAHNWLGLLPSLVRLAIAGYDRNLDDNKAVEVKVLDFFRGRMVQYLRDQNIENGVALAAIDGDIADIPATAFALTELLQSKAGQELKASYVRAQGILKKSSLSLVEINIDLDALEDADKNLWNIVQNIEEQLRSEKSSKDRFELLSKISAPLNNFFDMVLINDEDENIKNARLSILQTVISCVQKVANFDRLISG